jgi:hypothetical protein
MKEVQALQHDFTNARCIGLAMNTAEPGKPLGCIISQLVRLCLCFSFLFFDCSTNTLVISKTVLVKKEPLYSTFGGSIPILDK